MRAWIQDEKIVENIVGKTVSGVEYDHWGQDGGELVITFEGGERFHVGAFAGHEEGWLEFLYDGGKA